MKNAILVDTNNQKILDLFIRYPEREFLAGDIEKQLHLSKGGVNQSLRKLSRQNLVIREKKGSVFIHAANNDSALVKQLKVLRTVRILESLVNKLKRHAIRVGHAIGIWHPFPVTAKDIEVFLGNLDDPDISFVHISRLISV